MIGIGGLGATLSLQIIDRTKSQQLEAISETPQHARAIAKFRESAAEVTTARDFVENYDVYNLVMKAHGLEDQMFGKAMMRKILESDIDDPSSLVRRMTDERFEEIHRALDFTQPGKTTTRTSSVAWQEEMVDKYVEATFVSDIEAQDPIVGNVLKFRERAPEISNWYDILADKDFATVVRTAFGMPSETALIDVDKQVEILKSKMSLEDFQDPEFVASVERKYTAVAEAQSVGQGAQMSPIVQLFQSSGSFVGPSIDVASLANFSPVYR